MYLYGLVHRTAIGTLKSLPIAGISAELIYLESGDLVAIVEPGFPVQACAASEQALIDAIVVHDRVLLSAFAVTTVLPLRFGTEFATDAALLDHLQNQQQHYLAALTALQGKAEMSLKLSAKLPESELISASLKGREYFQAKKEQSQQQQMLQTRLDGDRQSLIEELQLQNIRVFTKSVDHYLLLCDRGIAIQDVLTIWQLQMKECDSSQTQWSWKVSEMLPAYHFAAEVLADTKSRNECYKSWRTAPQPPILGEPNLDWVSFSPRIGG